MPIDDLEFDGALTCIGVSLALSLEFQSLFLYSNL